ncbi:LOW QUALITY PROTEIN: acyl-CoA synthetase (AMP-forming)/AMP-acid ligase II [Methylomicrobium album BG8]|uniref:Acyl-CoA synthetase (AMP-forming)/AMP-acid ligase II n=1 Tax=Methylomicrobium album BG8 TaxID=686340 RepID=H8GLR6_METAL|nr:LOW QUALITY PROTEIN: acyl-CoA synthetase (AMP-forming)/AMP-acid ligase II [Methylomicrobium album BG8]
MLRPLLRFTVKLILKLLFRVEIHGMENYDAAGKRVLIVANHTSFLDPMLLWIFLPDDITFAINTHISERWWLKPFLGLSKVFRMDPTHPLSLKDLTHHLQHDTKTVIFPEGRITVTGTLMKIYDGTGMVADKSHAVVLPVRIEGAKYTHFSRLQNVVRLRWFPKITISILPPTQMRAPEHLRGKARRQYCGHILTDIMTDMMFKTSHYRRTIFSALLEARRIHGGKFAIADDLARKPVSYNTLIARTIALGNLFASVTEAGEHVGVMLPNSVNTLCVVLGLQLHQRIPAMLNFSTGSASMISACKTAEVKTVLTSRQFIDKAKLDEEAAHLAEHANLIYLEDLAAQVNLAAKLKALLLSHTTGLWYKSDHIDPEHPAVVLFTSGSEGTPKGVVLSYANILGNLKQLESVINFNPQDVVLNFLPMFHSFGFTVGSMLPVLNGMQAFFYPTPLHYAVIPEIAYEIKATVMFGTNTFLAAYGKKANPYDFFRMRYVGVAGAEKLQENTRALWADKFGIRILEGYGATETTPITSVNTPMNYKAGTVGRFMPGMKYQLEPVPGIHDGGQLHVSGPNIMQGYLLAANPGKRVPPESKYGKGWYDTGDIVSVDGEGYITIKGRSKRFAKVSGEMVSLTAVEQYAIEAWPEGHHAAVSLPDPKKGEQVILLTTHKGATLHDLTRSAVGVAQISLPRKIFVVDVLPVLATGKTNYIEATSLAAKRIEEAEQA